MPNFLRRLTDGLAERQARKEEEKRLKEAEQRAIKLKEEESERALDLLLSRLEEGDLSIFLGEETLQKITNNPHEEYPIFTLDGISYWEQRAAGRGNYSGVRIRIVKGVYYHTGGWHHEPVTRLARIDSGILQITNKRIRFNGNEVSKEIKFSDLDALMFFRDDAGRIKVTKRGREKQMHFTGIDNTTAQFTIDNKIYDIKFTGTLVNFTVGLLKLMMSKYS